MENAQLGQFTREEINSQPEVWRRTLEDLNGLDLKTLPLRSEYDQVIFTGCGSTHYLSIWAARLCQQVYDRPVRALPASELIIDPDPWLRHHRRTLLVAVSRSGTTTETVRAVRDFHSIRRGDVLAITCYPESELAKSADAVIVTPHGQEQSVAQTRSFSSMTLAAAYWITGEIPGTITPAIDQASALLKDSKAHDMLVNLATDAGLQRFFFLANGPLLGMAYEAMLKLKEMSQSYAEAYQTLEFRHGPMSMVNDQTLVIALLSRAGLSYELPVLADMKALGARILALAPPDFNLEGAVYDELAPIPTGLPDGWTAPFYLLPLQVLSFNRALFNGRNPDRPENLTAVVELKEDGK